MTYESKGADEIGTEAPKVSKTNSDSVIMNSINDNDNVPTTFSERWTFFIKKWFHTPIMHFILLVTGTASHGPKQTIAFMVLLALGIAVIGLFTNFYVETDESLLWPPQSSKSSSYKTWIAESSNFPKELRPIILFFHSNGQNVLGQKQIQRTFQAIDVIRTQKSYIDICSEGGTSTELSLIDGVTEVKTCQIWGINKFWNSSTNIFQQQGINDDSVISTLSLRDFPDGVPVPERTFYGATKQRDNSTDKLTSVLSYTTFFLLPDTTETKDVELDYVDLVLELNNVWAKEDAGSSVQFRVEVQSAGSFGSEFGRAILIDIPLIPIVFVVMSIFTCAVFSKRNPVQSRILLGFFAVVSVFLSILCGYGLLFCIGVPFTSMTQILPFIVFGVGLDDAYIIMGSYDRTNAIDHGTVQQRIEHTMKDIGVSITLTTLTTICSFCLGATSSIPAVFWLCLYAFPTIALVYLYQLTFFVGCIVLDEYRIEQQRRDFCCRLPCTPPLQIESNGTNNNSSNGTSKNDLIDRLIVSYAKSLMNPLVRVFVLVSAAGLCGLFAYTATMFKQEFKFTDVLPDDSYLADFQNSVDMYVGQSTLTTGIYFRTVDQSDPIVQTKMIQYVDNLVQMNVATNQPANFWLRDYNAFIASSTENQQAPQEQNPFLVGFNTSTTTSTTINTTATPKYTTFYDGFDAFMADPVYQTVYKDDIVRDNDTGKILSSRCFLEFDQVDLEEISSQIDALEEEKAVTSSQPVNVGQDDYYFFTYDQIYNIWEFYSVVVDELVLNTITGIVSVTSLALLLIPHWSAACFVFPLICIMYIDVLGFMQVCGIDINAVSYVTMVMAIVLLVDFIMHVLLRYYECPGNRTEKTIEMLRTMGVSILIGGISTFLGTLPLAFSTSNVFFTIFIVFLGLVIFGLMHGLVVLPVLLSMFGPEDQVTTSMTHSTIRSNNNAKNSIYNEKQMKIGKDDKIKIPNDDDVDYDNSMKAIATTKIKEHNLDSSLHEC